jgi:hypothetical protein
MGYEALGDDLKDLPMRSKATTRNYREFLTMGALLFPFDVSRRGQTLEIFDVPLYSMNGLIDSLRDESRSATIRIS